MSLPNKRFVLFRSAIVSLFLAITVMTSLPTTAANLIGHWSLNAEETKKNQPRQAKSKPRQRRYGAVIGGIPIPPSERGGPIAAGTVKKPLLLTCQDMVLDKNGNEVNVICDQLETRVFRIGSLHGRVAKFSEKKLTERYQAVSRRVSHEFRLVNEDRLRVELSVKPNRQKAQRYVFIFDRVVETNSNAGSE